MGIAAARRECERGVEYWFETGWIFIVPHDHETKGWYRASDNSPPEQPGFDWLRTASTTPMDLVGSPTGNEESFDGDVEDLGDAYRLTTPQGVIVLDNSSPPSPEPPPVLPPPPSVQPIHCCGCPHPIILPSGDAPDMRLYAGCKPHYDGGELVRVVVSKSIPTMTFHRDGAVTTLNKAEEILEGEDARAFYRYIEQIGLKVT